MIRRRLSIALVAAASTTLALVTPVHAADNPEASSLPLTSLSSTVDNTADSTPPASDPENQADDPKELPGWAQSAVLDDRGLLAFEIVGAIMAVGLALTQAAVVLVPILPGGTDALRSFLAQFGL